jgi:exosortase/archaeosortase family protein
MLGARMQRAQVRFAIFFAAISALLLGLYAFPYQELGLPETWFNGYLAAYARLVGRVLGLIESGVHVDGTLITGRYALRIVKTCDAMEANALFAAAVLALGGPWRRKLGALVVGLVALIAVNVLRITTLYYAGALAPGTFRVLHEEVWPLVLIALAALAFVVAAGFVRRGLPLEPEQGAR